MGGHDILHTADHLRLAGGQELIDLPGNICCKVAAFQNRHVIDPGLQQRVPVGLYP